MNTDLTKSIEQYLELDTNYAIILNGDYGIGKTHYVKNELFTSVKKIKVPSSTEEFYKPILISLFGVNSIDDLQNQILIEIYPIFKNKGIKIASGIFKTAFKQYTGSDWQDLLSDTDAINNKNVLSYSKILLCIDDIDRKSESLELKEVFGFINNLVENSNAKVMLIANEDELRKEGNAYSNDNYSILREKVIGISFTFKTKVSTIYDEIIKTKYYVANKNYFNFLVSNKESIIKTVELNNDNLRNLVFFFEHFKIIFSLTLELIDDEKDLNSIREELILAVLNFSLPISVEYKQGKINSKNADNILSLYKKANFTLMSDQSFSLKIEEKVPTKKSYEDEFREKYLNTTELTFFHLESVFKYIIGISHLDKSTLLDEIKKVYRFENNEIPRREEILEKLKYWDCINLSFSEYKKLTYELLKYVDKGDFDFLQYTYVFNFCIRFENKLGFDINKLKERFKKGIKKRNECHMGDLEFYISVPTDAYKYDDVKEISDYCISKNDLLLTTNKLSEVNILFDILKNNLTEFLIKFEDSDCVYKYEPFFDKINFKQFWYILKKTKNSDIIVLARLFSRRYREHFYSGLNPEKDFVILLKDNLYSILNSKQTSKMKYEAYKFMFDRISTAAKNFQE